MYCLAAVLTAAFIAPNPPPLLRDYPVTFTLPLVMTATLLAARWAATCLDITVNERLPGPEDPGQIAPAPDQPTARPPEPASN